MALKRTARLQIPCAPDKSGNVIERENTGRVSPYPGNLDFHNAHTNYPEQHCGQGSDSLKSDGQKWVCLLQDRSLEVFDTPTSHLLLDRILLGHAIRIAPGGTQVFVQTVAGNRIEMRHSEWSEMDKWAKAISTLKRRAEPNPNRGNRKGIPDERQLHKETAVLSAPAGNQGSPVESKSRDPMQNAQPQHNSDNDPGCNVLQEIAGSNLSDDEYDPEEDATQSEEPTKQNDSAYILKSNDAADVLDRRNANQGASSCVTSVKITESDQPFASSSSQKGAPFHRVFIQFNEGAFTLRDRTLLKSFFSRYGEVTDVYLPQTNRKVSTR